MHEAAFTEQIVDTIIAELKKNPDQKPKRIKVSVGEIYHLQKRSVQLHYAILTQNTGLSGVQIDFEEDPVCVECHACHKLGIVEDHHLLMCRFCSSLDVTAISGNEIRVEFVDMEPKKDCEG